MPVSNNIPKPLGDGAGDERRHTQIYPGVMVVPGEPMQINNLIGKMSEDQLRALQLDILADFRANKTGEGEDDQSTLRHHHSQPPGNRDGFVAIEMEIPPSSSPQTSGSGSGERSVL